MSAKLLLASCYLETHQVGSALRLAEEERAQRSAHIRALRDRLLEELPRRVPGTHVTGPRGPDLRLSNSFSCCLERVEGETVLLQLDLMGISASSGSACTSASLEPSYVLKALGVGDELAHSSIRFSLGRFNTEDEIDFVIDRVVATVRRLREMSPLYEMVQEGVDLSTVQWAQP